MRWFRLYHSVLDSAKVRRMPEGAQLDYFFVLCLAAEYRDRTGVNTGETGITATDAAWRCRRDGMVASVHLMERAGLVQVDGDGLISVPDWSEKQCASDNVALRVKKHRTKARNVTGNVSRNVTRNVIDKSRVDKSREEEASMSGSRPANADVVSLGEAKNTKTRQQATDLLAFLNEKASRHFRPTETTLRPILARLREGFSVGECRAVVIRKCREWGRDDKMRPFLRPETLFGATKFAQYVGEVPPETELADEA